MRLPLALCLGLLAAPGSLAQDLFVPGGAVDSLARALAESGARQAVAVLSEAIRASRDQALAEGTGPIPAAIRAQLSGYVPEVDLETVRWRVGGGSDLSLQHAAIESGTASAITLIDVVVFESEGDALANASLWAHELRHVAQYREWGVEEFSRRYLADSAAVEADATGFAAKWQEDATSARLGQRPSLP